MKKEIRQINLHFINPDPTQPRKDFDEDELQELAQSIKQNGLLNPITVKSNRHGEYPIIAGERRYRAHQILDLESIECIVFNGKNSKELQLVENINGAVGDWRMLQNGSTCFYCPPIMLEDKKEAVKC